MCWGFVYFAYHVKILQAQRCWDYPGSVGHRRGPLMTGYLQVWKRDKQKKNLKRRGTCQQIIRMFGLSQGSAFALHWEEASVLSRAAFMFPVILRHQTDLCKHMHRIPQLTYDLHILGANIFLSFKTINPWGLEWVSVPGSFLCVLKFLSSSLL